MTRKDFEIIARVIALSEKKAWGEIGAILSGENDRFDPVRFWQAVEKYRGEK